DMVALAIKLSLAGAGDYWDMVDRWTRNLFAEGQLTCAHRVHWLAAKTATTPIASIELPPFHVSDRVVERNIGGFGYALAPNDFVSRYPYGAMNPALGIIHCCTGNGSRSIYYIWENVVGVTNGRLQINLLLNHASKWADIDSHIPYAGQVDVTVKRQTNLSVRIPEWVTPHETTCTVNTQPRGLTWDGRYANIGQVQKDDIATLHFPIGECGETIDVEKRTYRLLLRGNTCVAIDPPGADCPLFERDYYRTNTTRRHKVTRFVSDQLIEW
ncbi:MAG: glycoside hydrolase family 127 protein, partial [Planctomycetota bacterium]|nr:glycoside hydrolase family 127 protein [Planctomycetota bacterium]